MAKWIRCSGVDLGKKEGVSFATSHTNGERYARGDGSPRGMAPLWHELVQCHSGEGGAAPRLEELLQGAGLLLDLPRQKKD
jgi:hypothetical protein